MIVELMRPAGPDLVRRWIAALLSAPEEDREAIVESIEARMAEVYAAAPAEPASEPGDTVRVVTTRAAQAS